MERVKIPNGWVFHLSNDSLDPRDWKILRILKNGIHRIEVIYNDGSVTVNGYEYESSNHPIMILEGLQKGHCKPLLEFIKAYKRRDMFYSKSAHRWITYDCEFNMDGRLVSVMFIGYPAKAHYIEVRTRGARRTFEQCIKYAEKNWQKYLHD